MAYGLLTRIVRRMVDEGWVAAGQTVGDPFGGIGTGGIVSAYYGLHWVGVELELRFVDLAGKNFALHRPRWANLPGCAEPRIINGDSRRFAELVGEAAAVVTSPPYAASDTKPTALGIGKGTRADGDSAGRNKGDYHYPQSEGQIGSLKEGTLSGVVTSPPWEDSASTGVLSEEMKAEMRSRGHKPSASGESASYGSSVGQIGNTAGETYWQAMHAVYSQMFIAMKPGSVAAIVVKDYVKGGKRVPLCDDTCTLLTHLGFDVFERTRAWLVKRDEHPGLFDEAVVKMTERKSFFRRLAEKKGSPRIDFEEVIWAAHRRGGGPGEG